MRRILPAVLVFVAALSSAGAAGIAWHEGDVQSAFDRAERDDKPLFLYWGAVWCPPCNQIKKTIFTQREFIEKTKLFIPVYLDGDTESAQSWGEKLDVWGYPTMLVLDPDGREVMRLPTGLQLEEFNKVLDEAMTRLTPIGEILDEALDADDPDRVPDRSYSLLAYYSWGQDRQLNLSAEEKEATFRSLARRAPENLTVERTRFFLLWLTSAQRLARREPEEGEKPFRLTKAERKDADRRLREILTTPELTLAGLEFLSYYSAEIVGLLYPEDGKSRRKLIETWTATMSRVEQDESLSVDERMSALFPELELHELQLGEDAAWTPEIQDRVRARAAWTDEAAQDSYTRQAALGTAGYLLRRVGLNDEARALYLAEIEKSETPYYFMSSLATMARKEGDNEQAVDWLARAYESAAGRATRMQWGTSYLIGLIDLTPDDAERIQAESTRIFGELLQLDDAFAGRNNLRIERLAKKYDEWNADRVHDGEVSALRETFLPVCDDLSSEAADGEDSLRARCSSFFGKLGEG